MEYIIDRIVNLQLIIILIKTTLLILKVVIRKSQSYNIG